MKSGVRATSGFWKLRLPYQVLLLWLPVLAFLAGTVAGMYSAGIALASSLGINIQESIASQQNGGTFFWSIILAGVVVGIVFATFIYFAVLFALASKLRQGVAELYHSLKTEEYPSAWL